jgi:chemotaxis protein methyltransferase WspC
MPVTLAEFEQLLKDAMGLDAVSIGSMSIERALQERQAACRLPALQAYWEHVRNAPTELQALIEAVVVRETWFFREKEAFAALVRVVQEEWLPQHPGEELRVLSLPCSTGEEPYTVAMALLDAGVPAARFRVDGIDISRQALDEAKNALYAKNSFRGTDLGYRDRHFVREARGYRLSPAVARQVNFEHGNIFAPDFLFGVPPYDIIFCRNVLIYFDSVMQHKAVSVLSRLLQKTGWLFVGSSETGLLSSRGFSSARMPLAFAFRKTDSSAIQNKLLTVVKSAARAPRAAAIIKTPRPAIPPISIQPLAAVPRKATSITTDKANAVNGIEQATRLADQGRLEQAAGMCNEHVKAHGPSAKAFYLLGLIQDARGDFVLAADYYRKTLYLDPAHAEAMIHLACLLEKKGDQPGARLLRARFERTNSLRTAR